MLRILIFRYDFNLLTKRVYECIPVKLSLKAFLPLLHRQAKVLKPHKSAIFSIKPVVFEDLHDTIFSLLEEKVIKSIYASL